MISDPYSQPSSTIGLTTLNDFLGFVNTRRYGVAPGHGYGMYKNVECPYCRKAIHTAYAKYGSVGYWCIFCGAYTPICWYMNGEGIGGDGSILVPTGWRNVRALPR